MANDFDESQIQWHDAPKFDENQIKWQSDSEAPKTDSGLRGDVAAFLRGASEQVPFARDIGAAAKAYVGNPLTGERATGDFAESKKELERRNAQLAEEHPLSYGAGEIGGGLASIAVPEAAGANLIGRGAQAEAYAAQKLAPILRSSTEAKLLSGLGSGAIAGAGQGAIHGLGTGTDLEDRLSNATGEAIMGAPFGAAGSALGHAGSRVARKVGEWTGKVAPIPKMPTPDELLNQSRAQYAQSKAAQMRVSASAVNDLYKDLMSDLRKASYNPARRAEHRGIEDAVEELRTAGRPLTLDDLDQIHRMTTPAAKNWNNPEGQTMAAIFRGKLNNFLDNLQPHQTITQSGKASDAVQALKEGRHFWKQGQKLEELGEAYAAAENRAGRSGIGGNFNNAYRQEVGKILDKADERIWTPDELQAMREFVKGGVTQNLARGLGRFSPAHHSGIAALEAGYAMLHPGAGLGAMAAGYGAHKLEDYLTKKAGEELKSIVAAGGKKANLPHYNPAESVAGRAVGVPATTSPVFTPALESPVFAEDREERASGGRIGKRDYPAKRLTRVEKAVRRAQQAIALETKPLLDQPDHIIANALDVAMNK